MGDGAINSGFLILLICDQIKLITGKIGLNGCRKPYIHIHIFLTHGPKTLRGTGNNCDGESSVKGVIIQGVEAYLF